MTITELAIKRPILFIVFFLILGGLSIMSYQQLKYELLPNLATPTVTIYTAYPGASPEEAENSVTKKIEDAVAGVSKSKKIISSSADNFSVVSIEFIADADPDQAMQEVQRAVNRTLSDFPNGVKTPVLEKFNVNDLPVLKLGVTAGVSETELYDLVNNRLKARLEQIKGVGRVKILGGTAKEIKIFGKQNQLIGNQLSITELSESIRKANADYPVGSLKASDAQFGVRLAGKITDSSQIENLKIRVYPDGSSLRVNDVATVQTGQQEAEITSRLNGVSSIALFISKQSGANAVEVTKAVKLELEKITQEYPDKKVKFDVAQDSSAFTLQAAHNVYDDLGIAIFLVAMVMLVFLHSLRNAFIVMISIPVSLFSAFVMMYALDYSLNLMTLLAMSLVVGVLVDDSIVVLENIYRHLEMGKGKREAALDGRNEIGFAALSITLVDVVVFLPMALVPGLVGSLIREFSLVIVVSTLSSLVVSFTVTPMIASRFAKSEHLSDRTVFGKMGLWFERGMQMLTEWYAEVLSWSLSHKLITGLVALSILGSSLLLLTSNIVGTEFLPAADKGELSLFVDMQPGTKLAEMATTVRMIEEKLKTIPEVTKLFSNTGYQNDGFNENYSANIATVNISLVPAAERTKSMTALAREFRVISMQVPGVKTRVSPIGLFGANEAPVQILVTGTDRDSIATAATAILDRMRKVNGMVSPRLSSAPGKPELKLVIDRDKLAEAGLTIEGIGDALRLAVFGNDQLKFREQDKEVNVRIQLAENERSQTAQLLNYSFINAADQVVYLSQFAKVELQSGPSVLGRRNKLPSTLLLAQVAGRPVGDVGDELKQSIQQLKLPKGVKILYEGDLELQDDSFGNLGMALLVSFILVYLIMVTLYNNWVYPFVILFSIPLAISGALLALALSAKSLNIFSIFGLIMMMGLVVKNGILLVDKANESLKNPGIPVAEALVEAGKVRLRPILMTTLAMVIGMLPLAFAKGASAAFSSGLAWVLIGGLSSSMFLTLIVVPVVYDTVHWIKDKLKGVFFVGAVLIGISSAQGVQAQMKIDDQVRGKAFPLLKEQAQENAFFPSKEQSAVEEKIALTLQQAVTLGLNANQQVKLAFLDAEKAKFSLKEAQSYLYPQVGAAMQYVRNVKPAVFFLPNFSVNNAAQIVFDDKNLQPIIASSANAYNAMVNVNMPLFNREVAGQVKAAHLNEGLVHANVELTRWELADEIRKAYFNVLMAKQNQVLTAASLKRSLLNLKDSRLLMRKGYTNRSDTLNAWSNVQLMEINTARAETAVKQTANLLKSLLNVSLDTEIELKDSIGTQLLTDNALLTKEVALPEKGTLLTGETALSEKGNLELSKRPDIQVNDWQNAIARQQISLNRTKYLPSLSLISQYALLAQADNFKFNTYNWPNSFFAGIQLNIPVFSGFLNNARVKQSRIALEQVKTQRNLLENQANLQISNAKLSIQENIHKMQSQMKIRTARQEALDFIHSRWLKGFAKYPEVADAELLVVQANNDYINNVFDYLSSISTFYKSTGHIL